jgi:raffinose/stachyose/melibiose transport system substrate-binding protein
VRKLVIFSVLTALLVVAMMASTTVQIWSWRSQDAPVWKEVQKEMNAQGIDVKIDFRSFLPTEYDSKVQIALQGGKGPDIIYSRRLPGQRTQALIDAGLLIPIDDKVSLSHFNTSVLNFIKASDGKHYGVPFAVQVVGIFYNKDIYKKYGLKVPKTWSELVKNAEILKKNGVTPFFAPGKAGWALAMQHAMTGVSVLGPCWIKNLLDGQTNFLDPAWVHVNKLLDDLKVYYQKGFMANTTDDLSAAFAFGQAAMVFYGVWGYGQWKELNPDINVGYFMVPPDCEYAQPWAYVFMDGSLALTSNTKHEDMAIKVLQFAATPRFGTIFAKETLNIPAVKGATMPNVPLLQQVLKVAEEHAAPYVYWVGSVLTSRSPSLYTDVLSPGMQAMYAGKITPEEFAKMAQDKISQWYEPLKKK